jgi:hypothetical protein
MIGARPKLDPRENGRVSRTLGKPLDRKAVEPGGEVEGYQCRSTCIAANSPQVSAAAAGGITAVGAASHRLANHSAADMCSGRR